MSSYVSALLIGDLILCLLLRFLWELLLLLVAVRVLLILFLWLMMLLLLSLRGLVGVESCSSGRIVMLGSGIPIYHESTCRASLTYWC